jgi:hypothetical protein
MMRFLLPAVVAAVLVGSAGAATISSGLRGFVMRGPVSPVCVAEQPCSAPAKGVTLDFSRNGRTVGRTTTNAKGWYRVTLRPALYSVGIASAQTAGRGLAPTRATVITGRYRRLDFSIDTGIR